VGGSGNDVIHGIAGNDSVIGDDGDDTLWGDAGDDTLDGGAGSKTLVGDQDGGLGNDTFIVNSTGDVVVEWPNEGNDTIVASVSFTLPDNVENLVLTGTAAINGTGNTLDNTIAGNAGNKCDPWVGRQRLAFGRLGQRHDLGRCRR
jgi:Ca2+-binding RTX toxin-like protein